MSTRWIIMLALAWLAGGSAQAAGFGFEDVRASAEALSHQPFTTVSNKVPQALLDYKYEKYAQIRFDDKKALWRAEDLPFCLEFFLPGYIHNQTVKLNAVNGSEVDPIAFDESDFNNPDRDLVLPPVNGYAGFRIVKYKKGFDEVAVFLDATYFRMIGTGQNYGTSARGLALNTVKQPEEFPHFQQFWIVRPQKAAEELTLYALMDSPSVSGAYQFVIHPGVTTVTEVKAALFPRRELKEVGLAPLTSMFIFDQNSHPPNGDFRPAVHDADGLLMESGRGEWIWRPLEAGKMLRVDAFQDDGPHGFGLLQRDRNFDHYQDLDARFQLRPNVWVKPLGNWGQGAVDLVQLASNEEFSDNTVAYWVPATPLAAGRPFDLQYELHWTTNEPAPESLGHVVATRFGLTTTTPPHLRFVVEFGGPAMAKLSADEKLTAEVDFGAGAQPVTHDLFWNEYDRSRRLVIEIMQPHQAVNMRAFLKRGDRAVTETWNFTWQP